MNIVAISKVQATPHILPEHQLLEEACVRSCASSLLKHPGKCLLSGPTLAHQYSDHCSSTSGHTVAAVDQSGTAFIQGGLHKGHYFWQFAQKITVLLVSYGDEEVLN